MNPPSSKPFFIVGCGRSGTTLLRTLLNGHPDIGVPQESLFITDYLRASESVDLTDLKRMLIREPELGEWGIHPSIEDLDGCETAAEAIDRLHRIYLERDGKQRWGQKTPRFVRSIGLLRRHFPGARFIHLVRDPRAVVSSLISSDVHRSNALYGSRRWLNDVSAGIEAEKKYPQEVLRVRYEDLVTEVEPTLRAVASFLAFTYDPSMVAAAAQGASEYSRFYAAIHANLNLPPTDRFISKWTDRLTETQVEVIEGICRAVMAEVGYEPKSERRTLLTTRPPKFDISRAWGIVRQSIQYLRFRRRYLFYLVYRKMRLGLLKDFVREVNY